MLEYYFGKKDEILFFETFIFVFEGIEFENWPKRNGLLVQCYSVCGNKLEIFEVFEKIVFKDCSNKLIKLLVTFFKTRTWIKKIYSVHLYSFSE